MMWQQKSFFFNLNYLFTNYLFVNIRYNAEKGQKIPKYPMMWYQIKKNTEYCNNNETQKKY